MGNMYHHIHTGYIYMYIHIIFYFSATADTRYNEYNIIVKEEVSTMIVSFPFSIPAMPLTLLITIVDVKFWIDVPIVALI